MEALLLTVTVLQRFTSQVPLAFTASGCTTLEIPAWTESTATRQPLISGILTVATVVRFIGRLKAVHLERMK